MSLIFTQLFDEEISRKIGITRNHVRTALDSYDTETRINFNDLEITLYLKYIDISKQKHYLLVCTRNINGKIIVDLAFKILPKLIFEIRVLEPLIILQELAQRFGLDIKIGDQVNKFILEETVTVDPRVEATNIVEIMNPLNHSFMQSIFCKIEKENVLRCAIAYCIDTDKYQEWLSDAGSDLSINLLSAEFAPQLKGQFTVTDLISSEGTIYFVSNYSEIGNNKTGYLFKLQAENFLFELGFTTNHFYIRRNGDLLEYPINPVYRPSGMIHCYGMWTPTTLKLLILDETYGETISRMDDQKLIEQEVNNRTLSKRTFSTLPPISLINAIRKMSILPNLQYEDYIEFNQQVVSMLQTIQDKINTIGLLSPFWNIIYDGSRIVDRKPKRETDIHRTIHGLLFDQALAKNIQIIPEYPVAGGNLDFLIIGFLNSGETATVCIEFKLAHSQDLEDGLKKQLPAYMRAKGCDFGIYGVLYFRGPIFPDPKEFTDDTNLGIHLHIIKNQLGLENIRIIILDVSQIITPSKL